MNNKKQIFLIILLIVAVAIAAFYWFSTRAPELEPVSVSGDTVVVNPATVGVSFVEGEEVLKMLEILKSTTLELSLFDNPVFQGLVDYSVELGSEPVGRDNPFLPFYMKVVETGGEQ